MNTRWQVTGTLTERGAFSTLEIVHLHNKTKLYVKKSYKDKNSYDNETKALQLVKSPYVIRCFELIPSTKSMILEYARGDDLLTYILEHDYLSITESKRLLVQIAKGISAIHEQHIVHHDLKPDNIVLHNGKPKIIDFGLCAFDIDNAISGHTDGLLSVRGTLLYAAPETILCQDRGFAIDWWGLGLIFYAMVTGCTPWSDEDGNEALCNHIIYNDYIQDDVPEKCIPILDTLLCKDPMKRLGSQNGLIEIINELKKIK